MRGRRRVAILGVAVALVASCGSQLPRSQFEAGGTSTKAGGTEATGVGDATSAESSATGGAAAAGDNATGATPGGPTAAAGGGTAAAGGAAKQANGASDIGVTDRTIKVGSITTVGGPMPGQFEPFLLGVRTWVNQVNE